MRLFGLIGHPLSHSFSKKYFTDKFIKEQIEDCSYELFSLDNISKFPSLISKNPNLEGLNVTIPYKVAILPFLDELDESAKEVGAVNCIKIMRDNPSGYKSKTRNDNIKLVGFNTDAYGFQRALMPYLKPYHKGALIIGTGGAAKAVGYCLKKLEIDSTYISRNPKSEFYFRFADFKEQDYKDTLLIVNASPIGMVPNQKTFPPIVYSALTPKHLLFDLVYNPKETLFMQKGKKAGAIVCGGLQMLQYQADKSWDIWNEVMPAAEAGLVANT